MKDLLNGQKPELLSEQDILRMLDDLPADLDITLTQAGQLIAALPPVKPPELTCWQVRQMGVRREKEEQAEPCHLAELLSADGTPFSIGLRGKGDGTAAFIIGDAGPDQRRVTGALRAACGKEETVSAGPAPNFYRQSWCVCRPVRQDADGLEKPKEDAGANWLDVLARSAAGMDYEAALLYLPLDQAWLDGAIQKLARAYDLLTRNGQSSMQISVSGSMSTNEIANIVGKARVFLGGDSQKNPSSNVSVSEEMSQEHLLAAICCEGLKYRLRELVQLRRGRGWCLCVRVSANTTQAMEQVRRVMGNALLQGGYACRWEDYTPNAALLLPDVGLDTFAAAPEQSFPGFVLENMHDFAVNLPPVRGEAMELGNLVWNDREISLPLRIPLGELNRHSFICGMTGSGKSNTVCSLLCALPQLPFLVIEPVKGEYRSLQNAASQRRVEVFTMDVGSGEQMSFNPFWFPAGGNLQYHIDSLKAVISAAFDLSAAMPNILEQCLTSAYVKKGWKIGASKNVFAGKLPERLLYPTFSTLCEEVSLYLDRSDFSGELKGNYKGALLSRLQSFTTGAKGLLLNCTDRPRFPEWIRQGTSCVLELDALADDADKAIVMGALLSQYFQCVKYSGAGESKGLRHLIVLEEAHHLFKEGPAGGEGGVNSRQQLVETLNNLLAEIRAYGEGVLIVDQSPTGISPQVIKNTAVKIVHRTDYGDDLEVLRRALLLEEEDADAPAALEQGFALARFGAMKRPIHVRMPLCQVKEDAGIPQKRRSARGDYGSLQTLFRLNEAYEAKLESYCGKLLNHLLFDTKPGMELAQEETIRFVLSAMRDMGYSMTAGAEWNAESFLYAINSAIESWLYSAYPDQQLVCGQIRMAADRFLSLSLHRKNGVRDKEWAMLQEYCIQEIYPALGDIYRNSAEPRLRRLANQTRFPYTANLLWQFSKMWDSWSERMTREELMAMPPEERSRLLTRSSFLVNPDQQRFQILWREFQAYLDSLPAKA